MAGNRKITRVVEFLLIIPSSPFLLNYFFMVFWSFKFTLWCESFMYLKYFEFLLWYDMKKILRPANGLPCITKIRPTMWGGYCSRNINLVSAKFKIVLKIIYRLCVGRFYLQFTYILKTCFVTIQVLNDLQDERIYFCIETDSSNKKM